MSQTSLIAIELTEPDTKQISKYSLSIKYLKKKTIITIESIQLIEILFPKAVFLSSNLKSGVIYFFQPGNFCIAIKEPSHKGNQADLANSHLSQYYVHSFIQSHRQKLINVTEMQFC